MDIVNDQSDHPNRPRRASRIQLQSLQPPRPPPPPPPDPLPSAPAAFTASPTRSQPQALLLHELSPGCHCPSEVTVRHVPSECVPVRREEIQLLTHTGKVFMSDPCLRPFSNRAGRHAQDCIASTVRGASIPPLPPPLVPVPLSERDHNMRPRSRPLLHDSPSLRFARKHPGRNRYSMIRRVYASRASTQTSSYNTWWEWEVFCG